MARTEKEIKDLNNAAQDFLSTVASMSSNLKTLAKDIESDTGEASAKSIVTQREFVSIAEKLRKYTKEDLANKKKSAAFLKTFEDARSKEAALSAEINELVEKGGKDLTKLTKEELKKLEVLSHAEERYKGIVGEAEKLKDTLNEIDEEVGFFESLSGFASDLPGVGKLFGEFERAAQASRKAASEGGNSFVAGAEQFAGAAGKLASTFALAKFVQGINIGSERITTFSRQLNMSNDAANALNTRFVRLGATVAGIRPKELEESLLNISEYLGITADLTNDTAIAFATLTGKLGLSADQAANLTTFTSATGKSLGDFNRELVGTVLQQNYANDAAVRYQDVFKDISQAGAATQMTISKFPGGIQKAAYQARRLGLSFSQLESSASALLNFESSIEAELEAELLTGKELNLERARLAALTGDQATLAAELAKNFGSAAEFSEQNVLAQEAQAKAMGMTREELGETLMRQEAMRNLGASTTKEFEAKLKAEQENIKLLEKAGKFEEARLARQDLFSKLGDSELKRQIENRSLAERQAEAMEQLAEAASTLAAPFQFIGKIFDGIGTTAGGVMVGIGKISSKLLVMGNFFKANLLEPIAKATSFLGKLFSKLGGAGLKATGKTAAMSLLKKIPVLGLIVGAYAGYKRFSGGDTLGAIMEMGSGIASLFPGIGTGISAGIDTAILGRDVARRSKGKSTVSENASDSIKVQDFTIKTHPKDSLVMAGGTKLNAGAEKTNQLLEKLITAVEKGGHVYMDGNKVGQSLVLSSYQSS